MPTVSRSLLSSDEIASVVESGYGVTVIDCVLLRSLVNDVYRVTCVDDAYVVKLYQYGRWSSDAVDWELRLTERLAAHDIAAPRLLLTRSGSRFGVVAAPEGQRVFAVTRLLVGETPSYTAATYREFGLLLAGFHTAAEGIEHSPQRRLDPVASIRSVVPEVLPLLTEPDRSLVADLATTAERRLDDARLTMGVRHGDVSLDNLVRIGEGLALYDFDSSGHGPVAADFTGVAATEHWEAFLSGYRSSRLVTEDDLAALPWLSVVASVENLRFHLIDKAAWRGTQSREEGWVASELDSLRAAGRRLMNRE